MKKKTIKFLVPYPHDIAPGQRFRYEQYLDILKKNNFDYELLSFLDEETNKILYKKGHTFKKVLGVLKGFLRRFWHIWKTRNVDFVFVYREATPIGFPYVEWILAKIFYRKIIYDFDDAIWIPATSSQNKLVAFFKSPNKVKKICKWSYKISTGNEYLQRHANEFSNSTTKAVLNPTTIDLEKKHTILHQHNSNKKPIIGWTGSHSTLIYLNIIIPILKELELHYDFVFRVICNQNPNLDTEYDLKSFEFVKWNKATEIKDLSELDIGVMPLTADAWAEGKCGFKALQYMALGVPAVISPIGVNKKIINQNENGFLADTENEWKQYLSFLLENSQKRQKMGALALQTIQNEYSVQSNTENFLRMFT
ncbi:glycosyltransferase family 4 protein [Bernardetia sp. OM2101]|uniref:glycosyltransferase family 4 protein n=1 Tax=Bernardetia sp. OM2101 TaxID=3344876 RepID=UPI0035CEBEC8